MTDEEIIDRHMQQALGNVISKTLENAAHFDHLAENEAVLALACAMLKTDPPKLFLATKAAMLAVRWHRTRQTETAVNSPGPGPSPE